MAGDVILPPGTGAGLDPAYEAAQEFMPQGLMSPEEWADTRPWVRELDYEAMFHEARDMAAVYGGQAERLFSVLAIVALIERRTIHYIQFPMWSRTTQQDPTRMTFLNEVWVPDEVAHSYVDSTLADMGLGNGLSTMDEHYKQAVALMPDWQRWIGNRLMQGMGQVAPNLQLAFVYGEGAKNETVAEFNYWAMQQIFRELGYDALAKAMIQPKSDESTHRTGYRNELEKLLGDNPHIRAPLRAYLLHSKGLVGQELRTKEEGDLMMDTLFDPRVDRHRQFIAVRDQQFTGLPGMKDVRPVESTLRRLGMW